MISFYLFWCLGYLALLFWLAKKWPDSSFQRSIQAKHPSVTLIIPFRNEAAHAHRLINSLIHQSDSEAQIFLVDDQSEDDSFILFQSLIENDPQFRLLQSPGVGKKAALDFAISQTNSEVILTSDADCVFPKDWIKEMSWRFEDPEVQLIAGPVVSSIESPSFFEAFQQLEWCSILLLTQLGFVQRKPLMCSAANLAFRKSAFEAVSGYTGNIHLLSGDDEFLLKKIVKSFGSQSCLYLPFREVLVITSPQKTWNSLLNQRIRWASKWRLHRDFWHAATAIFTFFSQVIWLGAWVVMWFTPYSLIFVVGVFGAKIFAEKLALGKVGSRLGVNSSWEIFLGTSLIHPGYVLLTGALSLWRKVHWKGRKN